MLAASADAKMPQLNRTQSRRHRRVASTVPTAYTATGYPPVALIWGEATIATPKVTVCVAAQIRFPDMRMIWVPQPAAIRFIIEVVWDLRLRVGTTRFLVSLPCLCIGDGPLSVNRLFRSRPATVTEHRPARQRSSSKFRSKLVSRAGRCWYRQQRIGLDQRSEHRKFAGGRICRQQRPPRDQQIKQPLKLG